MTTSTPTLLPRPFPTASSYTPRSEHESATPATFFGEREVLYAELGSCDVYVYRADVERGSTWQSFLGRGDGREGDDAVRADATGDEDEEMSGLEFVEGQWHKVAGCGFVGSG